MKVIKNNNTIHQQIKKIIHESLPLKVGIWAQYVYTKNISENADKGETFMTDKEYKVYFHQKRAPYRNVLESTDINKVIDDMIHQLDNQMENFDSSGFAGYA